MGQRCGKLTEILGIPGWKVVETFFESQDGRRLLHVPPFGLPQFAKLVIRIERRWAPRCSECSAIGGRVHEQLEARRWSDHPWAGHPAELEYAECRLDCWRCGHRRAEHLPWADPYQRQTKRFQHHLTVEAASMPVTHVAALHGLDWHTVRRAEGAALARWAATRTPVPLHEVGLDEKYLGRRHTREEDYVTIASNLETGEPIWIGFGRGEATVASWLATLSADEKAAIRLFAMDMHEPFRKAVYADEALAHVAIVHDPFHVVKRAGEAVTELRRDVFFRAGELMRGIGRGAHWLLLRAWERCTDEERVRLKSLLAFNPVLARAYQIKEELREVLRAPDRATMEVGLQRILRRTQARRHVPLRKLHESLLNHRERILALAEHHPATGRIEALNNNWETLVRRGRGYRDLDYLLLKLRFMTVNPIRDRHDMARFLALGLPVRSPPAKAA